MSSDPRLPDLFAQASELEGPARAAWLEALRRRDATLAAEVDALLAASTEGQRRFEAPAWAPGAEEESSLEPAVAGVSRVGSYRIVRELGRGGMGRVFLAEQEEAEFRRSVALKLIDRPGPGDEGIRRFRDELRILAPLEHPGIARFLDGGRSPDGVWFLALEYVEGEALDEFVGRRGLDLRQRIELFLQVLDAVDFAHRRLVVHRDLKPSNVLVGADGRAKLLDFGVSKILDPEAGEDATRTELRAFTPAYASPEQLRGERVTVATDIYSLGVMLYELLAGRRPFARRDAKGALVDWTRMAAERDPEPPSTAARQLAHEQARGRAESTTATRVRWRDLSGDLDAITLKALRAEPESRYRSAAAMADDLRRWLRGEPVDSRRGGRRYRLGKFVRRNRWPVAFAALALVALLTGAVIAGLQARSSARERDQALENLRRAEITNDLSAFLLSEAAPREGKPASKADLLKRGESVIDQRFASDPALRVHMLLTVADRYYENDQYDDWKRSVEHAYTLSRQLAEKPLRALAACLLANVEAEVGDPARASALLDEALRELAAQPDYATEARCRVTESNAAYRIGDSDAAIRAGERALALERLRRGPPGRELEALNSLANAYTLGGRFADADRTYGELMELFEMQGRDHTLPAAICLNNWAVATQGAGQMTHAVDLSERAVALGREVDPERGAPAASLWTLASAMSLVGRQREALEVVDEAVTKVHQSAAPWQVFWALATAGRIAVEAGQPELAAQRIDELERWARSQPRLQVSQQAGLERTQARLALQRGDAPAAVKLARVALDRLEVEKRPPRELLPVLLVLASALNADGDFAGGRATAERAAAMATARLGGFAHSHELGVAHLELGVALGGGGSRQAARAALETALADLRAADGEDGYETRRAQESLARVGG